MKLTKKQTGYTILETLIVLAVTGVLFLTTTLMIRGQVEKTNYQDSMRQLQQKVQQVVKDTENGYFPSATGTHSTDIFVGKRITFCGGDRAPVTNSCTDRKQLRIQNIQNAVPTGIQASATGEEFVTLPNDLSYIGSYNVNTGSEKYKASMGFMTRFSLLNGNGSVSPGCAGSNVYCSAVVGAQQSVESADYNGNALAAPRAICLEGYRKGSLVFGVNGGTSVELNLDDPNCSGVFN